MSTGSCSFVSSKGISKQEFHNFKKYKMKTMRQIITALMLMICIRGYAQVSVTATAGTLTGSYTTLNAAFAAINAGTHRGAINISITGNTIEPSPPTSLVGNAVSPASYTRIHISPSGGSWTVRSSAVPFGYRGIIELFGAQHVTIDGDPAGTGSRGLTFEMVPTTNLNTCVIRMGSTDTLAIDGAAYDTVRNCNVIGGRDSINSAATSYGILVSGNSISSVSSPGADYCNFNTFTNNTFSRCSYALYMNGGFGNAGNTHTLVRKNYFLGSTLDTTNNYCIYLLSFNYQNTSTTVAIIDSNDFTGSGNISGICIFNWGTSGYLTVNNNNFHDFNGGAGVTGYSTNVSNTTSYVYAPLDFYNNILQNCTSGGCLFHSPSSPTGFGAAGKWDIHDNTVINISGGNIAGIVAASGSADSLLCHNNLITNLSSSSGSVLGIATKDGNNIGTQALAIYDNIITGLSTTSAGNSFFGIYGGYACGIYAYAKETYNNMVSNITAAPTTSTPVSDPFSSSFASGIPTTAIGIIGGGSIYANTVALNINNDTGSIVNAFSAAIYSVNGSTNFRDNIIYNSQNSTNAYGFYGGSFVFSGDTLDYNEYYVPFGNVGYTGAAPEKTLLDWQAATGVQDLHSVSGPVAFISTTDLHIDTLSAYANNLFRNGTYISIVPVDIDGQSRHNPPCIGADEFMAVNALPDSIVWPGDADANHVVDNADLLPIGLAYDSTGPVRAMQGIVWQGDIATNWSEYFSTYAPTVNFNHADCNGDGIINAADTMAIMANFSLTHAKTGPMLSQWRSGIPAIKAVVTPDTAYNGDTLTVTFVLGDTNTTVNNFYGLAFTYNFDPRVMDSTYTPTMGFLPTSWIGTPSQKISINKIFGTTGQILAAVTRINHTPASGSGAIAKASFRITTDNISGKNYHYYTNIGSITDVTLIDQYGAPIPLNAGADTTTVGFYPNGIREITTETLRIQPNPAHDKVLVSAGNAIREISLTNIMGQQVMDNNTVNSKSVSIDISGLDGGVYIVQVRTEQGTGIAKLVVQK